MDVALTIAIAGFDDGLGGEDLVVDDAAAIGGHCGGKGDSGGDDVGCERRTITIGQARRLGLEPTLPEIGAAGIEGGAGGAAKAYATGGQFKVGCACKIEVPLPGGVLRFDDRLGGEDLAGDDDAVCGGRVGGQCGEGDYRGDDVDGVPDGIVGSDYTTDIATAGLDCASVRTDAEGVFETAKFVGMGRIKGGNAEEIGEVA